MLLDLSPYTDPLSKTPSTLRAVVEGRPDAWLDSQHDPDVCTPRRAVAHLVLCDSDESFIDRIKMVLDPNYTFETQNLTSRDLIAKYTLEEILDQFDKARAQQLKELAELRLTESDLERVRQDEEVGDFTLGELLNVWVAHDLYHLGQIFKSYSALYVGKIGIWNQFLNLPHFN